MSVLLGIVFGGLITFATAFLIERLRKPKLGISIEEPPLDRPTVTGQDQDANRILRLKSHNKVSPLFAPWMQRASAARCRGEITFHHLDGQDVYGRSMVVRWANSPEPIIGYVLGIQNNLVPNAPAQTVLSFKLDSRIDVYPGEEEPFDIAVRFHNEKECYGWNNEAYLHRWRTPHWKLGLGRFLVKVTITSSGQKCEGVFRLVNDVESLNDFRLIEAQPEDRRKVGL